MSIFYPHFFFRRIYEIPLDFFQERGIRALLIDVDNTLTTDNNPVPHEKVLDWLDGQRARGMKLLAFSNNHEVRVAPFAKALGLGYIADAAKPLTGRVKRSLREMGVGCSEAAVIGDQIFTDVLCARLSGCTAVLVEPMKPEGYSFYVVKRKLEAPILRRYHGKERL